MPGASLLPDRLVVAAAVVLTTVLFAPSAADPVNVAKLTALASCVALLLALAGVRAVRHRVFVLPVSAAAAAAAALLVFFVASAVAAPQTTTALLGVPGRNSGLVAYASASLILLFTLRLFDARSTRVVAFAVLLGGLFTAVYGGLQLLGWDAIRWNNPFNPVIAALGNPDFASGYLGIATPVAAWGALWTGWNAGLRVASALVAALCFGVAVLSEAVLGPIAGAAGLLVLALGVTLDLSGRLRQRVLAALAAVVALGAGALLLGLTGRGPAGPFFTGTSYEARTWYWSAALEMWQRNPVIGVGLDAYGTYWWRDRPLAAPRLLGGDHFSDSAHSVPLQHLAQGGLLLFLAYLALFGIATWALISGLLRLRGQERLLLAGLGGSWVAYHVQSLVSIDQVPLITVGFVLSGAVVVAAGHSRLWEVRLPGAAPVAVVPPKHRGSRRAPVAHPRPRTPTGADYALLSLVGFAVLGLLWVSFLPLRASRAAYEGDAALGAGDGNAAVAAYDRAIDLVPGAVEYELRKAQAFNAGGLSERALAQFRRTMEVDPNNIGATRAAARLAAAQGDLELARELHVRALRLDPSNSGTILDLAIFDLEHGRAADARALLERWAPRLPGDAGLWARLGDARLVTGDRAGAREAYNRALALDPEQSTAIAGLQKLEAAGT